MSTSPAEDTAADELLTPVRVADYLEQDPQLRGQRFACVSFVSPGDAIAAKDAYATQRFLASLGAELRDTLDNIATIFDGHKAVGTMTRMLKDKHAYLWDASAIQTEFALFREQQSAEIDAGFAAEHGRFKTNVHGFKIRGAFDTVEEATERAKNIKKFDEKFNVYVAEVGCWCPWNPSTAEIKDVEYAETQLNTLMKKYAEGQDAKTEVYDKRKTDLIKDMDDERAEMMKQIQAEIFERDQKAKEEKAAWDEEQLKKAAAAVAEGDAPAADAEGDAPAAVAEGDAPAAVAEGDAVAAAVDAEGDAPAVVAE